MATDPKILPTHVERRAAVYLRQSTLRQVREHGESTARQYGLGRRAVDLGWPEERIEVIDEDLGHSGVSAEGRDGFHRLAEDVARGRIGAIFALEASRLARSSVDWHQLLELCALADVLLVDERGAFSPRDPHDRLLLGLKGALSEAEQQWMCLRLEGARLNKARRGELFLAPPTGYVWHRGARAFRIDPDEGVQRCVRMVFERFRIDGSATAVARYFVRSGLQLPMRNQYTGELRWRSPRPRSILRWLRNPAYAGTYVYGRRRRRAVLVDGRVRRHRDSRVPPGEWKACVQGRHPAYIDSDEFMANQRRLEENRWAGVPSHNQGAAREGAALLQGLTLCGRCGQRMRVRYGGRRQQPRYQCPSGVGPQVDRPRCWHVSARAIDGVVTSLFFEATQPPELELSLAVLAEAERQAGEIERQWSSRRERAQYDARLAEQRYKAVDPQNRVVARTLEREWDERLRELENLERDYEDVRRRAKIELTDEDRARILALAKDLPSVWGAPTTTHAERKNLLRLAIAGVTLTPVDLPTRATRVQVLWYTGAVSERLVERRAGTQTAATSEAAVRLIETLFAKGWKDRDIAQELNERQLTTGANKDWEQESVRTVRRSHGMTRIMAVRPDLEDCHDR